MRHERIDEVEQPFRPMTRPDPVRSITRAAIAKSMQAIDRKIAPEEYVAKVWPFDREAMFVLRAATEPASLANATALVEIITAFLPALVPFSAAAKLFELGLSLSFGNAGGYSIPGVKTANSTGFGFVSEGGQIPVIQGVSSASRVDPFKLAVITTVSSELFSQPSVEDVLRRMLVEGLGQALDAVAFSNGAAVASLRPAGLLNGIAPLTPATAGDKESAIKDDLVALATAVGPVSGAGGVAVVCGPGHAVAIKLRTLGAFDGPVLPSSAVPESTVIMVALNALVSALGVPEFETSTQAMLQFDNAPTAWPSTSPTQSMFQAAQVAIKNRQPASWALRDPRGLAWMQNVNW